MSCHACYVWPGGGVREGDPGLPEGQGLGGHGMSMRVTEPSSNKKLLHERAGDQGGAAAQPHEAAAMQPQPPANAAGGLTEMAAALRAGTPPGVL